MGGSRVQVLISIETHITCDFPVGVWTPYHPLWIRTWSHRRITLPHYMCKLPGRVKSGKFQHYLQIVLIQMRRLLMSRRIRSLTICLGNLFYSSILNMKQTRLLSEISRLSEYIRLYSIHFTSMDMP